MLEHGGNLNQAIAQFGGEHAQWLDVSTGINPHWYLAPPLSPASWHRLPEPSYELIKAAKDYYAAPELLAVAGTQAAIQVLPRLRPASRVVIAAPTYAEHAHHWSQHGHSLRQIPYAECANVLADCDVMVICNPNNPTGAKVAPQQLLAWSRQLALRGGWLIVDEAYADMTPELSVIEHSDQAGLIVLRSVGKFFGLAGLRLGFVAAESNLLHQMEALLGPWAISTAAQQIGLGALNDRAWQSATRQELAHNGLRLNDLLARFGRPATGCGLFQWWPEKYAEQCWLHMAQRQILVRLFTGSGRGIRLGLPADELGWQRLSSALQEWDRLINTFSIKDTSGDQ
jgi:cobalamin biosynthetic protein CobC